MCSAAQRRKPPENSLYLFEFRMLRLSSLLLTCVLMSAGSAAAQEPAASPAQSPPSTAMSEAENRELQGALAETSNSPGEIIRTLEKHLAKYPQSAQKDEILRVIS